MTITAEQLKFRQGKIGASQFGQAIGHGYGSRTRAELFHQINGNIPTVIETMAMRVGNFMEPFILSEYARHTGRAAEEFPETQVHPDEPRIICHCDGITSDKTRLIEIKNVGHRMMPAWEKGVPEYYWVQGCGQSMLTGIKKVDFAAYFGGNDLKVFEVEYTDEDHAALYDGLKDFLSYVDRDECPPHIVADLPNLDKYYEVDGQTVEAEKDIVAIAHRLAGMKNHLKADKGMKDHMSEWEFVIKEYMGGSETLVDNNGEVIWTWKRGKDKEVVDWEMVSKDIWVNIVEDGSRGTHEWAEKFREVCGRHTTTKQGSRTFLCKIKD